MSEAVLISIRPEWCEKIANGEKTIEIRKSRPKIETPFKCYIYCTKPSRSKMWRAGEYMCFNDDELYRDTKGRIKYGCSIELMACDDYSADNFLNGKVIGEFVCDAIFPVSFYASDSSFFDEAPPLSVPGTCLTDRDIAEYLGNGKTGYGWHISELKIYDKPKALSEFMQCHKCEYYSGCKEHEYGCNGAYKVTRPPMSWCYVEELP